MTNPFYGKSGVAPGVLTNATVQQVQLDAKFPQYTSGAISGIQNGSVGISYQDIGSTSYNALQATLLIIIRMAFPDRSPTSFPSCWAT